MLSNITILKPEKPVFLLPVTYQTQYAETWVELLWALYSTAGLYANNVLNAILKWPFS